MDLILKVDRVKSVEEAIELQSLDVDFISVALGETSKFDDDRLVSIEQAFLIQKSLRSSSKFVSAFSENCSSFETLNIVKELSLDYVQIDKNEDLAKEVKQELYLANKGIIYSPITISYDEDIQWSLDDFDSIEKSTPVYFQLDLLGDMTNAWEFLVAESPKYPDELQIEDIDELALEHPILLTTNFSLNNIDEILSRLPHIRGLSFVLGNSPHRNDIHCFDYLEVVQILEYLKSKR
jgi:hypothetical protein